MKRFLSTITVLLIACTVFAQWRTSESALEIATKSAVSASKAKGSSTGISTNPSTQVSSAVTRACTVYSQDGKHAVVYGFNYEGGGFALVSGCEYTPAILGYADKGTLPTNLEDMPDGLRYMMSVYQAQIAIAAETMNSTMTTTESKQDVEPLLKTTWSQSSPYNKECPNGSVVGCVAVVMGQVMKYHQWPTTGTGSHNGYDFSSKTWDWSLMLDSYTSGNYSTAQADEVAQLLHLAGESVDMQYGTDGSAASCQTMMTSLNTYWGYDDGMYRAQRQNYSDSEWEQLIYDEVSAGRPVPYEGNDGSEGHAFILDGYKDGQFHTNWGWGGYCDGYFTITSLVPEQDKPEAYKLGQAATINVKPADNNDAASHLEANSTWTISDGIVTKGTNITVTASVINTSLKAFSGKVGVVVTDMETKESTTTYSSAFSGLESYCVVSPTITVSTSDLTSGHSYKVTPVYLIDGTTEPVTLNMLNTQATLCFKIDASGSSKEMYPRRMVVEEGAGTWCGYCPRAITGTEYMRSQYPDNFISIAIHSGDIMDYREGYGLEFNDYPSAYFNRVHYNGMDKSTMEYYLKDNSGFTTDAMVKVQSATYNEDFTQMTVKTNARFGFDATNTDYRMVYVVTENNVGPYSQTNSYSGSTEEMGGFENMPNPCQITFDDVARGVYPSNTGVEGCIPASIQACTGYAYDYTFTMPTSIESYDSLDITVLLYNATTGEIVNADRIACPHGKKFLDLTIDMGNEPGTLAEKLGSQIYDIASLTIKGQINGTDLYTLHQMMGCDDNGSTDDQKHLKVLDLQDAQIVKGGYYMYTSDGQGYTLFEDDLLPNYVFGSTTSLRKLITPKTLKKIGVTVLEYAESLEEVVLFDGLEEIGSYAFRGSTLKTLHLPSTVIALDGTFYYQCTCLTDFSIAADNPYFIFDGQYLYTKDKKKFLSAYPTYKGDIILDDNCIFIGGNAISNDYYNITGIVGKSVKQVEDDGLDDAECMKYIALGAGLKILNSTFNYCFKLTSIYLGCTEVPSGSYSDTNSWSKIGSCTLYVPEASIEKFRASEFWSKLKEIKPIEGTEFEYLKNCGLDKYSKTVDTGNDPGTLETKLGDDIWDIESLTVSGKLNSADLICLRRMAGADSTWTVSHKTGVLSELDLSDAEFVQDNDTFLEYYCIDNTDGGIPSNAFRNCGNLVSVVCPKKATSLGGGAFTYCSALKTVKLNDGLQTIKGGAFSDTNLAEISIPESVTTIQADAFSNTDLSTLYIPGSVTSLTNPVAYCDNLTEITFGDGSPYVFEDGLVYTKDYKSLIFGLSNKKGTVLANNNTTTLTASAFRNNSNITGFVAANAEVVESDFLNSAKNLNAIYLGKNVQKISANAFGYDSGLTALCINTITPPVIEYDDYFFIYHWQPADNFALYVPSAAIDAYKSHDFWSRLGEIKAIEGTVFEDMDKQGETVFYPRRTVFEEHYASWSANCVGNLAYRDKLLKEYPDNALFVSLHVDDEMSGAENYDLDIIMVPDSYTNRKEHTFVNSSVWKKLIGDVGFETSSMVKVKKAVLSDDKKSIDITSTAKFGEFKAGTDYRIAYVITEDGVGPYTQNNSAYCDGKYGEMGGYEKMPSSFDMTYDNVARGIYPSLTGVQGVIPADIPYGSAYNHQYTITLPSSISDASNIKITALLYNNITGEIENADRCAVGYDSSNPQPLIFVDDQGTAIDTDSPLVMDSLVDDVFGSYVPLKGVNIKNTTDTTVTCRFKATTAELPGGSFQCCLGSTCHSISKAGTITIDGLTIEAGKSIPVKETEWYVADGKYGNMNVKLSLESSADGTNYTSAGSATVKFVYKNTTGIDNINADGSAVNNIYSIDGRRVITPRKGIYIINGRKVVK